MASPDMAPALLFWSDHEVLSVPNHRYQEGYRATWETFAASSDEQAAEKIADNGAEFLLYCPNRFFSAQLGEASFGGRLAAGWTPSFLVEVQLPAAVGNVRFFRVVDGDS